MEIEDTLRMWFTASDQVDDRIGYAVSTDGISWNLHTDTLLDVGPAGTFDEKGVFGAQVIFNDLLYEMWYNGYDTQPFMLEILGRLRHFTGWNQLDKIWQHPSAEFGNTR